MSSVASKWKMVCPHCGNADNLTIKAEVEIHPTIEGFDRTSEIYWDGVNNNVYCRCGSFMGLRVAQKEYKDLTGDRSDMIQQDVVETNPKNIRAALEAIIACKNIGARNAARHFEDLKSYIEDAEHMLFAIKIEEHAKMLCDRDAETEKGCWKPNIKEHPNWDNSNDDRRIKYRFEAGKVLSRH